MMTDLLWGVYPYVVFTLFFVVPVIRMVFRPYSFTTRASGLFGHRLQGFAMHLFHWGILLVFIGHVAGFVGGGLFLDTWVNFTFYWSALIGGLMVLTGSVIALVRRLTVPEVRAMSSQHDDYLVHVFLIAILGIALYQVLFQQMFGFAYMVAPWFVSIWTFSPEPELMAGVSLLTRIHVFLALTFFAYFPFTKMVHFWTVPINYFVRPYQVMRTNRFHREDKWEFALRSDKSFLIYLGATILIGVIAISAYIQIAVG